MDKPLIKIKSIREQVYEGIKLMIINGQIAQGEKLQESELTEIFEVSRTPVREALKMLKDDGLLESGDGKGLYVKSLTPQNVADILEIRCLLEQFALKLAIERLTPEMSRQLMALRAEFETFRTYLDVEEYVKLDLRLHNCIIEFSGNAFLRDLMERIYSAMQSVRVLALSRPVRYTKSIDEHIGIINAILDKDYHSGAECIHQHLEEVRVTVLNLLENQKSSDLH